MRELIILLILIIIVVIIFYLQSENNNEEFDDISDDEDDSIEFKQKIKTVTKHKPIDIVYSWIDGNNPEVKKEIMYWRNLEKPIGEAGTNNRFNTMDELRYSLRSVYQYAPWVRNVYIITSLHKIPEWFDEEIGAEYGIYFIDDSELLETVPVFNSLAKESVKHKIPGLSESYLYFNDDLFFGSKVKPRDFITKRGKAKVFLEPDSYVITDLEKIDPDDYFGRGLYFTRKTLLEVFNDIGGTEIEPIFDTMRLKKHTPDIHFVSEDKAKAKTIPKLMHRTANARFRDIDQIYDNTLFDNYWKLARGKAVMSDISYAYLYIRGNQEVEEHVFNHINKERPKVFCINDGIKEETPETVQSILNFAAFLENYFPVVAPWEIQTLENNNNFVKFLEAWFPGMDIKKTLRSAK